MNKLLTNKTEETFLNRIIQNLKECNSFDFSVSFIKKAGLVLIRQELENALKRGCKGRIITSTYQNFTDIESLRLFHKLSKEYTNFKCHLDYESFSDPSNYSVVGFHTKGYLFKFEDKTEVIVGSSNITRYALQKNIEWDLVTNDDNAYIEVESEFNNLWNETNELNETLIKKYTGQIAYAIERWDMDFDLGTAKIKPNYMQKNALKELTRYRTMGVNRAMVVCSAGSGKTYLSAFDALNFAPKRLLYIVHESSILKKALETYKSIFDDKFFGLYTGEEKEIDADFLFSTNISMANNLELFDKDEFDYIVIDECHHAVANSYKKIIEYFKPEFLLGLTATPERMDNEDVFELFDENIPYELRLRDSIINGLVVPFHYYGIKDKLLDYSLDNDASIRKLINQITRDDHIEFVHNQIEKYREKGKLKALVFCKNVTHARRVSESLSTYYKTAYLTGTSSVSERLKAYEDLQDDNHDLEVLCSVDILNEGVDIPGVNMVCFLRPTESSTVFIQQLGRGLRKYKDKQFVTILDFIGNSYKRSTQIALALGSLSENLVLENNLLVQLVKDNFEALGLKDYGVEINLDDLSKEEIINSIESENFNTKKYLKQDYQNFKKYIGSEFYPKHTDYLNNDCAPDLLRFMNIKIAGKKANSYYGFLKGIEEENLPSFSEFQEEFIKNMSNLLPLVRTYEYDVVKLLLNGINDKKEIRSKLNDIDDLTFNHMINCLINNDRLIKEENDKYILTTKLDNEFIEYLNDLLDYGLTQYSIINDNRKNIALWSSYSKSQIQRLFLGNPNDTMLGTYYYDKKVVIFVNLFKGDHISEGLNYNDKYLSNKLFQWESKNNLSESDLNKLLNSEEAYVYIRKCKEQGGTTLPFTYVGKGKLDNPRKTNNNGTYLFDIKMENEVIDEIKYDFDITNLGD